MIRINLLSVFFKIFFAQICFSFCSSWCFVVAEEFHIRCISGFQLRNMEDVNNWGQIIFYQDGWKLQAIHEWWKDRGFINFLVKNSTRYLGIEQHIQLTSDSWLKKEPEK